ncbi:MAG: hypothetical protein QXG01_05050 [Candidatus Bathyarchaeia archaeon]
MRSIKEIIEDSELSFENELVKVLVKKDLPNIETAGIDLKSFKTGDEVELPYWIAIELFKDGFVSFLDDYAITLMSLSKIHWRETLLDSRQITKLNKNFYRILKRFLRDLKLSSGDDRTKSADFEKALSLSKDIINCRLRKIVSLATASVKSGEAIQNLTIEEELLYRKLSSIVNEWKDKLLSLEGAL